MVDAVEIYLPLAGIIDFSEEERRLTKEIDKLSKDLSGAQRKLTNEEFLAKAPAEVVAKEQDKVRAGPKNSPNSKTTGNGSRN